MKQRRARRAAGQAVAGGRAAVALVVGLGLSGLIGAGCGSTPAAAGDSAPADFSLAVVVRVPEADADAWTAADRSAPRAQRPARYLVEADDVLRVMLGPGALPRTFPPPTRRLTRAQVESLWAKIREAGLLTEGEVVSREGLGQEFADRPAIVAEPTALLSIRAGRERVYRREVLREGSAVYRLTDELAGLAWIEP